MIFSYKMIEASDFDTKWLDHVFNSGDRERTVINNWAKVKSINFYECVCVIESVYIVFANGTLPNMRVICFLKN